VPRLLSEISLAIGRRLSRASETIFGLVTVGTTQTPTSAPFTLARFRVPRGAAEVENLSV